MKKVVSKTSEPLAFSSMEERLVLVLRQKTKSKQDKIKVAKSLSGRNFVTSKKEIKIIQSGKNEDISKCSDFKLSVFGKESYLTYSKVNKNGKKDFFVSCSSNFSHFTTKRKVKDISSSGLGLILPKHISDSYISYIKDSSGITTCISDNLITWKKTGAHVVYPRGGFFDSGNLDLIGLSMCESGILLFYDASSKHHNEQKIQIGAVLIDPRNPHKALWRSDIPVWQSVSKEKDWRVVGSAVLPKRVYFMFVNSQGKMKSVSIPNVFGKLIKTKPAGRLKKHSSSLKRHHGNPIINPKIDSNWQSQGTFNPGAVMINDNIHLFYRAIGDDGISRIGHATTKNALDIDNSSEEPVYRPTPGFGMPDKEKVVGPLYYNPSYYTSGGGWGGCEDPRVVKIGNKIYMSYVAFEGWNSIRIALTSIDAADVERRKWKWSKTKIISPPGQINKNWLIFPEKINGKYAILHSITPKISITYLESLDNIDDHIKSERPSGPQPGRINYWDNFMRGAGTPPLKTKDGWLILYHALSKEDPHRYKIGAMLLDLQNPETILHRSAKPVLSPDMHYENDGKPGIVYASGAVVKEGTLYVYYGGADKVVCVASAPIDTFLEELKNDKMAELFMSDVSVKL